MSSGFLTASHRGAARGVLPARCNRSSRNPLTGARRIHPGAPRRSIRSTRQAVRLRRRPVMGRPQRHAPCVMGPRYPSDEGCPDCLGSSRSGPSTRRGGARAIVVEPPRSGPVLVFDVACFVSRRIPAGGLGSHTLARGASWTSEDFETGAVPSVSRFERLIRIASAPRPRSP